MLKDPDATLPFTVDWSKWLANEDDSAATATWIVPTGIAESTEPGHARTLADGKATIWLTGGTLGQQYLVTCRLTTTAGRSDDRTLQVKIRTR